MSAHLDFIILKGYTLEHIADFIVIPLEDVLKVHFRDSDKCGQISNEYQKHEQDKLYQAVINIIVQAKQGTFNVEKSMLEAFLRINYGKNGRRAFS